MRHLTKRIRLAIFLTAALLPSAGRAQKQPSALAPEVQEYLQQASQVLLQRTDGNPAFQLKASFTATPPAGSSSLAPQTGTYEEIWRSPSQWQRDITLSGAKYSFGRDGGQVWQSPKDAQIPLAIYAVMNCVLPLIHTTDPRLSSEQSNSPLKLTRVTLESVQSDRVGEANRQLQDGTPVASNAADYFIPGKYLLMSRTKGSGAIKFSKSAKYAGKTVLTRGTSVSLTFPRIDFQIKSVRPPQAASPVLFTPPADAFIAYAAEVESDVTRPGYCISCLQPVYPSISESARVSGTVAIVALTGVDGSVSDARVISGPPLLRQAALDAVLTWRYEPTTVDGLPVPVEEFVYVNFLLN